MHKPLYIRSNDLQNTAGVNLFSSVSMWFNEKNSFVKVQMDNYWNVNSLVGISSVETRGFPRIAGVHEVVGQFEKNNWWKWRRKVDFHTSSFSLLFRLLSSSHISPHPFVVCSPNDFSQLLSVSFASPFGTIQPKHKDGGGIRRLSHHWQCEATSWDLPSSLGFH